MNITINLELIGILVSIVTGFVLIGVYISKSLNGRIERHPIIVKLTTCMENSGKEISEIKQQLIRIENKIDDLKGGE